MLSNIFNIFFGILSNLFSLREEGEVIGKGVWPSTRFLTLKLGRALPWRPQGARALGVGEGPKEIHVGSYSKDRRRQGAGRVQEPRKKRNKEKCASRSKDYPWYYALG